MTNELSRLWFLGEKVANECNDNQRLHSMARSLLSVSEPAAKRTRY